MPNMLKVHSYTLGNSSIHVYHRNISALVTRESSVHRLNSWIRTSLSRKCILVGGHTVYRNVSHCFRFSKSADIDVNCLKAGRPTGSIYTFLKRVFNLLISASSLLWLRGYCWKRNRVKVDRGHLSISEVSHLVYFLCIRGIFCKKNFFNFFFNIL